MPFSEGFLSCMHHSIKVDICIIKVFHELCLWNDGNPTFIHPATGSFSAIDLSICSPSLFMDFNWVVHDDLAQISVMVRMITRVPVPYDWGEADAYPSADGLSGAIERGDRDRSLLGHLTGDGVDG